MRNKRFGKLLSAALAAAMALSLSSAALAAGNGETHLTIIGTSDTHGNIWGYSYEDMKESTGDGLARVSAYVNQVRSENPNTILVDAGDTIQGTIMTDDLYSKDTASHPVAAALNYMDYDAWTLGNHEFNFGVDTLKSILEQVDMPVLAANIKNADGSYFTGAGYTIVERGGVKVAIIGVTTPNIPRWDGTKQGVADLTFEPMADAVAACIQEIGGQADVIMVSTHAGLGAEYSADGSDAAQTILDKCPEVDVLQLGHTHTTYINSAPIPVGEAKNNAGEVVRYDLTLNADKEITYEQAKETVLEALHVLGDDYVALLKEGFNNRWIDVYENVGKRGGAYSSGISRPHPYVLLNHKNNLDCQFTLAHEMGHALHSYHSCKYQPISTSDYVIFVAEVASTCNEVLLMRHLLSKTTDKKQRAYLINHFLDQFKGTVYRQTMFAEFELAMGKMAENGEALTADALCRKYHELNKLYFGPDMISDDQIALEWARIPHFFYNYYVFQYATGFSAAVAIANRILKEGAPAVADYKKFLSGGCSTDPISLLKIAGEDMSSPEPVNSALALFGELVDELAELL